MSRSSYSLFGLVSLAIMFVACGGDDNGSSGDAAIVGDDSGQSEAGTGVGRGRGGGGLEEGDGGSAQDGLASDASVDGAQSVDAIVKSDATVKTDAPAACAGACEEINTRYEAAVKVAKGCLTAGANQCALTEPSSLICGVNIPVNTNGTLNTIQKEWAAASCNLCPARLCPEIKPQLGTVACESNTTTAQAQVVGSDRVIIDPVIVLPPITRNDGTCVRRLRLIPL